MRRIAIAPLVVPTLVACSACRPPPPQQPTPAPSGTPPAPAPGAVPVSLSSLGDGEGVLGFTTRALYLDAQDQPIGARFVHDDTGFIFDYLRIESAPQGFMWVNSPPTSNMGEPHTQEHLLLGKGDRGRRLGGVETMALGESSAFTNPWRTCYHFHTVAGPEAFWTVFDNQLDALLHPDYSDEEIRREVAHYGVSSDPGAASGLRLEEKGTVYSEMVRTYEQPSAGSWRAALALVYGPDHPLALDAGGQPDAIRRMTPADIRRFHDANYHLGNMGMIGAFPAAVDLADVLSRTDGILRQHAGAKRAVTGLGGAKAKPAPEGTIVTAEFPYQDDQSPGALLLGWPAVLALDPAEQTFVGHLLSAVAGDESTPLYKQLIDSKTRAIDLGATGLWTEVSADPGQPIFLGISQVGAAHLDESGAKAVRALVTAELAKIAKLPAQDPELAALRARMKSRLAATRRGLQKAMNTPPGFGFRGTYDGWLKLVDEVIQAPGFKKSLVLAPQLAQVEAWIDAPGNPFAERLAAWGLLGAPYVVISRPSPSERTRRDREREARIAAETARLGKTYGETDPQAILRRYAKDYDDATRALEAAAQATPLPPLPASLPMTLDDGLAVQKAAIAGVPVVYGAFPGTTAGTVGLALRLDGVPPALWPFLGLLPALISDAGLIIDGVPVGADEVAERRRREIMSLRAYLDADRQSGRVELVLEASGIDLDETRRAVTWMIRSLTAPDLRVENLARLRDVVDREVRDLRTVMQGPEEYWAESVRHAYAGQADPLYLHAGSFLTGAYDAQRVRWMLQDPGDKKTREAAARVLEGLGPAGKQLDRPRLVQLVQALANAEAKPAAPAAKAPPLDRAVAKLVPGKNLAPAVREIVRQAGLDLAVLVPELPDGTLADDFAALLRQMAADLRRGAPATMAALGQLREVVNRKAGARLYVVGSPALHQALVPELEALVAVLGSGAVPARAKAGTRLVDARVAARLAAPGRERSAPPGAPVFVGLRAPSTSSGVFVNEAPAPSYRDRSDEALFDYLAANLYAGHGPHTLFIKTWAAGLAYSNGIRVGLRQGLLTYYAERCPELPQTLKFVIDELGRARPDESLVGYALAGAFGSRLAGSYESRTRAFAADEQDGITPELVRSFRSALLAVAKREGSGLGAILAARFARVYAKVLPGFSPGWQPAPGATYLVIGPDAQLDAWQRYLSQAVGKGAVLVRLAPRDFWLGDP
jgi:Zn-dependent M16 (insulinase) family peptidase